MISLSSLPNKNFFNCNYFRVQYNHAPTHNDTPHTSALHICTSSFNVILPCQNWLYTHRIWKRTDMDWNSLRGEEEYVPVCYISISVYDVLFLIYRSSIFLQKANAKYQCCFCLKPFTLIPKKIFCKSLYMSSSRFCSAVVTHTRV